jgi:hypothetical protein
MRISAGMEKIRIRDKHADSATLRFLFAFLVDLELSHKTIVPWPNPIYKDKIPTRSWKRAHTSPGLAAGLPEADHGPAQQADGGVLRHLLAHRAHSLVVELKEEKNAVNQHDAIEKQVLWIREN